MSIELKHIKLLREEASWRANSALMSQALDELEELKEIEKRYGLPLPVLFNLLEGKIKRVYVKEYGMKVKLWDKLGDDHLEEAAAAGWALHLKWFKVHSLGDCARSLDFKDFGKTWFLEKPKEDK